MRPRRRAPRSELPSGPLSEHIQPTLGNSSPHSAGGTAVLPGGRIHHTYLPHLGIFSLCLKQAVSNSDDEESLSSCVLSVCFVFLASTLAPLHTIWGGVFETWSISRGHTGGRSDRKFLFAFSATGRIQPTESTSKICSRQHRVLLLYSRTNHLRKYTT